MRTEEGWGRSCGSSTATLRWQYATRTHIGRLFCFYFVVVRVRFEGSLNFLSTVWHGIYFSRELIGLFFHLSQLKLQKCLRRLFLRLRSGELELMGLLFLL